MVFFIFQRDIPLQPESSKSGAAVVPPADARYTWQTLDKIGSYVFAALILVGGILAPLALVIYSLFFR